MARRERPRKGFYQKILQTSNTQYQRNAQEACYYESKEILTLYKHNRGQHFQSSSYSREHRERLRAVS